MAKLDFPQHEGVFLECFFNVCVHTDVTVTMALFWSKHAIDLKRDLILE